MFVVRGLFILYINVVKWLLLGKEVSIVVWLSGTISVSRARIVDVVQINVREQAWHWHSIQQCHGLIALYNRSINVIPYMDMFLSHEMIDELIKIYVFFSI